MGQYYSICDLDKREFIYPHAFGDGAKLMEFGCSAPTTMTALTILLADGNGRGGGDFHGESEWVGRWAGDRIVIAGDYADNGKFVTDPTCNLHSVANDEFTDISFDVLLTMFQDDELKTYYQDREKDCTSNCLRDALLIYKTQPVDYPLLIGDLESEVGKEFIEKKIKELSSAPRQKKEVKHAVKVKA